MQKYMHWCIDSEIALVHISPIETPRQIEPLFQNLTKPRDVPANPVVKS
jgi:hypothetical protein